MELVVINAVKGNERKRVQSVCSRYCKRIDGETYFCDTDIIDLDGFLERLALIELAAGMEGSVWFVPLCDQCRRNVRRIGWEGSGDNEYSPPS